MWFSVIFCIFVSVVRIMSSDIFSFLRFFSSSLMFCRMVFIFILFFSICSLVSLTSCSRLSSVICGAVIFIISPLFIGVKPRLLFFISFSISGRRFFSHGFISIVLWSTFVIFASCVRGVGCP